MPTANVDRRRVQQECRLLVARARLFGGGGGAGRRPARPAASRCPASSITTFAVGFDASWELDLFGGGRRGVEAARARTEAAVWNRRDAAVTLAAEVADAYFALRLDQRADRGDRGRDRAPEPRAADRGQHRQGRAGAADRRHAPDGNRSPRRRRGSSRSGPICEVRMHALGVLLGQHPEALLGELSGPLPRRSPRRRRSRPGCRRTCCAAARTSARPSAISAASTADIGVAVADLYPKFSLTGMAQLISTSLGNLFTRRQPAADRHRRGDVSRCSTGGGARRR